MIWLLALAGVLAGPVAGPREVHEIVLSVDGARVRALCTDGARDVLFLHGDGATADTWRTVLERLDGRVGACAYDRSGSGGSAPAPPERGWYELLDELHHVHQALGFDADYVLVGHGLGGLYARLYAADRPRDVGALLLVEPNHEDLPARMEAAMPRPEWERWLERLERPNQDGVREASIGDRARRSRLPRVPVTVITALGPQTRPGWEDRLAREAVRQVHADILAGAAYPRHIPAARSGHEIQRDQPGLVADEVMRLRGFLGR